ncbi:toll/interleukin-1 receptor domain-containing protein [Aquimarina pacifica]|uniref:toll/interleukin-1 receptor domain-containing protein n=1 Tax=Aquimarina pacifica TaxID=1296415 RepID=UPI0004706559|nr:toll/interleukin-1 receptor domain-containing protein [Aquimarina pacifica]
MKIIQYRYQLISIVAGIGVSQTLYYSIKSTNGYTGAPAITSALKDLGFNINMELGIKSLITIGILAFIISEYLILNYHKNRIEDGIARKKLKNVRHVLEYIETASIPVPLKMKLKTNFMTTQPLAQEISLYLFAKYEPNEIREKLNRYRIKVPEDTLIKRSLITKILNKQNMATLQNIQRTEKVGVSIMPPEPVVASPKKIFISHSNKDLVYVQEVILILETIGIKSEHIFCSSYEGYGNPLGSDYLSRLKQELQGNTLVLFILSQNFFGSKMGLCEMGATWILTQDQIPLYIPPFRPDDVKGVFPTIEGMFINKKERFIQLRERLEKEFSIEKKVTLLKWNRQIESSLKNINLAIANNLSDHTSEKKTS